jgi:hypothetical protein
VTTRAYREHPGDGRIVVETSCRYQYGVCENSEGEITDTVLPGGSQLIMLRAYDVEGLGRAWTKVFDFVAGVVQNLPHSIDWRLDVALNGRDRWLRGAVAAMVYSVAHELEIEVLEVGCG